MEIKVTSHEQPAPHILQLVIKLMAMKAMMKEMKAMAMMKAGRAIMNESNGNDESWEGQLG